MKFSPTGRLMREPTIQRVPLYSPEIDRLREIARARIDARKPLLDLATVELRLLGILAQTEETET